MKKGKLSYCPMKGKPGHCMSAQVWDENGLNLAIIDSRLEAEIATQYAKLFSLAPDLHNSLTNFVKYITEHPTESIELNKIASGAIKILKKIK